jgi:hypothetical protein
MSVNKTTKFSGIVDEIIAVGEPSTYLLDVPATTTVEVRFTLNDYPVGKFSGGQVVFAATGETITRTDGSWIDDHFQVGMSVKISGTTSNNQAAFQAFVVSAVTEKTLTINSLVGAIVDETVASGAVITGYLDATLEWFTHATVAGAAKKFEALEFGPTAIRFVRTVGTGTVTVWVRS